MREGEGGEEGVYIKHLTKPLRWYNCDGVVSKTHHKGITQECIKALFII